MNPKAETPDAPTATLRAKVIGLAKRLYASRFIRHASLSLALNGFSKVLAFFAAAFAAKCMGALNYGISGVAYNTAFQTALIYHWGLDTIAIRRIAAEKTPATITMLTEMVIGFRVLIASVVAVIWIVAVFILVDEVRKPAWLLSGILLWLNALHISFVFVGVEKLPIQNSINAIASMLSAVAIFLIFKPGMPAGADLAVAATTMAINVAMSWAAYRQEFDRLPVSRAFFHRLSDFLPPTIAQSWKYFLTVIMVYLFTFFQIPMVEALSNTREAGVYRTAFGLILGLDFFLQSFYSLLLPRVVAWKEQGAEMLAKQQRKTVGLFAALSIPIAIGAWMLTPIFYERFLGQEFLGGIAAFRILAISRLIGFITQVYVQTLIAFKRDGLFLIISSVASAASVTASIVLIPKLGCLGAAIALTVGEAIINVSALIAARQICRSISNPRLESKNVK